MGSGKDSPPERPPRRTPGSLMARAAILTPLALAVWWLLLKGASLWLLRTLAYVPLGLLIAPSGYPPVKVDPASGDWVFNVAVNATGKNLRTGQTQRIDSMEFAVSPDSAAFFACGWFTYLGLALSLAPFTKRQVRRVAAGLAVQAGVAILCLAAYVYLNGYGSVVNTTTDRPFAIWLVKYAYHIIYLVVPFAGPFLIALAAHPEWRESCVGGAFRAAAPAAVERLPGKRRREKRRA